MKTGILGGTFDPIHNGHLELARAALTQYHLDQVVFIPTNIPPHKVLRRDIASAEHRYKMTALAIASEPRFSVSKAEIDRPGVSYTAETLELWKASCPEDQLFLILGADAYRDFYSWRNASKIQNLATLLVAARSGAFKNPQPLSGGALPIDMPDMPVASTEVRALVSKSEHEALNVPEVVLEYIRTHHLYS